MYRIAINKERPDFRVFIDLLYGTDRNVDTEGDSDPVNSRTWTYLYIADRETDDPSVEVGAIRENPNVFEVESKSNELEEVAALYLFLYCGTSIAVGSKALGVKEIENLKRQYAPHLQRAESSIWHNSTNGEPYPNLA